MTRSAVAFVPVPKRHTRLVVEQRSVPPATLKLWRAWIFFSLFVAGKTLLLSEMSVWKRFFAIVARWPGFGVHWGVLSAEFIVGSCCKVGFPVKRNHVWFAVAFLSLSYFSTRYGHGQIEVIGLAWKKQWPPPLGLWFIGSWMKNQNCLSGISSLDSPKHTQCIKIWFLSRIVLHTIVLSWLCLLIRDVILVLLDTNVWALSLVPSQQAKQWVPIWILDHTIDVNFWSHSQSSSLILHFLHSRRIVHGHKRSSDQKTIYQTSSMTFTALNTFTMAFLMQSRVRFTTLRWRIVLFATLSPSTSLWLHYHQVHAQSWRLLQLCPPTMIHHPKNHCPAYLWYMNLFVWGCFIWFQPSLLRWSAGSPLMSRWLSFKD